MRFFIIFFLLGSFDFLYGQNINIALFHDAPISSFTCTVHGGKYDVIVENSVLFCVEPNDVLEFSVRRNKIHISSKKGSVTSETPIFIRGLQDICFFTISYPLLKGTPRSYDNDMYVSLEKGLFRIINDVNFEKYIAGVVEAEGGSKAPLEYYKAQAILCRTYAAKYYTKHLHEGFNLCDAEHCQAYKGRCSHNLAILDAALQTAGLVVVDSSRNLISATFYANSGGQTVNSEDVWITAVPYLRSVQDTFSVGMRGYEWKKEISVREWKTYLQSKGFVFDPFQEFVPFILDSTQIYQDSLTVINAQLQYMIDSTQMFEDSISVFFEKDSSSISHTSDSVFYIPVDTSLQYRYDTIWNTKSQIHYPIDFTFLQHERKKYFSFRGCDTLLRLREIRSDWKLRSTFFSIEQQGETILFHGKGYGHGVGLSQEGAMRMANLQFTYDQIIKFYFTGVQIMNIQAVRFFQIE